MFLVKKFQRKLSTSDKKSKYGTKEIKEKKSW